MWCQRWIFSIICCSRNLFFRIVWFKKVFFKKSHCFCHFCPC